MYKLPNKEKEVIQLDKVRFDNMRSSISIEDKRHNKIKELSSRLHPALTTSQKFDLIMNKYEKSKLNLSSYPKLMLTGK